MKKKRKKTYLSSEFYARGEETKRLLSERLEFHKRRLKAIRAQRESGSSGRE